MRDGEENVLKDQADGDRIGASPRNPLECDRTDYCSKFSIKLILLISYPCYHAGFEMDPNTGDEPGVPQIAINCL
jgi:hypothetical protein